MEETSLEVKKGSTGLLATIQGTPAQILIILGLALILLAPVILNYKGASLASSQAKLDQMKAQKELDLEEFKHDQAERRKKSPEVIKHKEATEERKPVQLDPSLLPAQTEARQKQEQEKDKAIEELKKAVDEKDKQREKALSEKNEELEKKYDTIGVRREIAEARTAIPGTRLHLVLGWLGHLLLLLGLLALMLRSEGLRQKVILIVLLVVMFSGLSKANRDFLAQDTAGVPLATASRMTERAPEAEHLSKEKRLISRVWKFEGGPRLQFKSDGKLVLMPPQGGGESLVGDWELDDDGKTIVITSQGKTETMGIVALSEKELKLKSNGQEFSLKALDPLDSGGK